MDKMVGGEIFTPKIPSMKIVDLAKLIAPGCKIKTIGIRPGEKLHEILITEEDGRNTLELDGMYIIQPALKWWRNDNYPDSKEMPDGFIYSSDHNNIWLSPGELWEMIKSNHDLEPFTARLANPLRTPVDFGRGDPRSPKHPEVRLDHAGTPDRRL
jgi:FlaA1/EpsC-like NDP-sugar epimerase